MWRVKSVSRCKIVFMRIAIVKLSALGDIVHSMIVLQFIKKYNEFIFLGLVDKDPMVSEEARTVGFKNFEKSMTALKQWFEEGHFKEIDFDLLMQINWSTTETIVKNLKFRNLNKPSDSELNVIWDVMKKSS